MRALRFVPFAILGAALAFLVLVGPGTLLKMAPGSRAVTTTPTTTSALPLDLSPPRRLAIFSIQKVLGIPYTEGSCAADRSCLYGAKEIDGLGAAYVDFDQTYVDPQLHLRRSFQCTAYLLHFIDVWRYIETACTGSVNPPRATEAVPRLGATVRVFVLQGCVNVRPNAGLLGVPTACLANGTAVTIDQGPQQVDSRLWWHLKGLGWMTHDVLLPADQSEAHSVVDDIFPHGDNGYGVCSLNGNPVACPVTGALRDRLQAAEVTLCRCRDFVCCRTVGVDPKGADWIARVQLAPSSFILHLARVGGRMLVGDELCGTVGGLDGDPATSIRLTTTPCTSP